MNKTFRQKLRKTKRYYKRGGGYKNRKKTKKNKRKRLKGGGNKIEKIDSFNTNISFFVILWYLGSSDDNANLHSKKEDRHISGDLNKNDMNDIIQYFYKYKIEKPSNFTFKYNHLYSYYKLSVKDKFMFLGNPQDLFNFNNYHAVVGFNHNIDFDEKFLSTKIPKMSFDNYLNIDDTKQTSVKGLFKGGKKYYYPSLEVDELTQNNIDEIEKKQSGGGFFNKAKKYGRNITKSYSKLKQSYKTSSVGHSTETSYIQNKIEIMEIKSKDLSYLIFQTETPNVNKYSLTPNKTIICPLDILIGFDHGCKIGICRNRNWNNNLQVSSLSNGFEGTKRDYNYFKETEIDFYQNLNQHDQKDLIYYDKEIQYKRDNIEKNINNIGDEGRNISDLGLSKDEGLLEKVEEKLRGKDGSGKPKESTLDALKALPDNDKYKESQDKDSTNIQKEIIELKGKIDGIDKETKEYTGFNKLKNKKEGKETPPDILEKFEERKGLVNEKEKKEKLMKYRKNILNDCKSLINLYYELSKTRENTNTADIQEIDTNKIGDLNPVFWISKGEWVINKNYVKSAIFKEWVSNLKIKSKPSDDKSKDDPKMDGGGNDEEKLERYKNYFFFIINDDQNSKDIILHGEENKEFIVIDGYKLN